MRENCYKPVCWARGTKWERWFFRLQKPTLLLKLWHLPLLTPLLLSRNPRCPLPPLLLPLTRTRQLPSFYILVSLDWHSNENSDGTGSSEMLSGFEEWYHPSVLGRILSMPKIL
jgi:hypothetical protein